MKILVTGTSGFLGSHIIDRFSSKHEVIGISKSKSKKIKIIGQDIRKINKIPKDISCIIHLAALTDIAYCENHPKECFDVNVLGMKNILDLARKTDCKFILPTSSHIFGKPATLPITENTTVRPLSVHGASKAISESICQSYSDTYGIDTISLRLFSIYGPKSPSYSIIYKIISQIISKKKIIVGNMNSKRDFLYISDFLDAVELIIKHESKGFTKYNIGFGKSTSIKELCNIILKIANKSLSIQSNKQLFRKFEVPELVCNAKNLKKMGWKPTISINEGLKFTFDWFASKKNHSL